MKTKTLTITTITADEGMMLTNGNAFAKSVTLGIADTPESWHEITQEEYKAILKEQENII